MADHVVEEAAQPFYRVPLELASMLFSHGIKPSTDELAERFGIDRRRFRPHHALDDARFVRELYLRAVEAGR